MLPLHLKEYNNSTTPDDLSSLHSAIAELTQKIAVLDGRSSTTATNFKITELTQRIAAIEQHSHTKEDNPTIQVNLSSLHSEIAQLNQKIATLEQRYGTTKRETKIAGLTQKIATIEQRFNTNGRNADSNSTPGASNNSTYEANHNSGSATSNNSPLTLKRREFWFVPERVRFLGVRLSDQQVARVDKLAADAYNQRHGKPPMKQMYRNNYAYVYPVADEDIWDRLIQGVAAGK